MNLHKYAILLIVLNTAAGVRGEDQLSATVHSLAQPRVDRGESVGIVVGVVRDGKTDVFGFGRPSLDDDQLPDGRTLFEIGSITKVFTAITLADMAEAKQVTLDDPVQSLLTDVVVMPQHDGRAITLRNLANHSSGLPRIIPKVVARSLTGKDPYADVTLNDMADFLKTFKLTRDPGSKYDYSNLGAGLLGAALARRANVSYEELVLARICRPLGMNDTRIRLDPSQEFRLAKPYSSFGVLTKPWTFDAFAGAGALRSTADDMLRFVRANLGIAHAPGTLRASMDAAMSPRTLTNSARMKIALGWHVLESKEKHPAMIWHNGGTGGFRSFAGFVREKKVGVVVLNNSDASIDEIGFKLLEHLLID